jgi:phosphate starvation-inducible protein PhoH and related proteins
MNNAIHKVSCNRAMYKLALESTKIPLVISTGPAGTSKTMTPCVVGMNHLADRNYERLLLTRPTVSVGNEELGFLPGDLDDKMAPWVTHMTDYVNQYDLRFVQSRIDTVPLAYIRGQTWKDRFIIADEMQNSTPLQMKTLLTRLGENTKLVITGDLSQSDLDPDNNGLVDLLQRIHNLDKDVYEHIIFSENDIVRSDFVKHVLKMYEN